MNRSFRAALRDGWPVAMQGRKYAHLRRSIMVRAAALPALGADSPLGLPAGYAVLVCALLGLSKLAIVSPPFVHGGIHHFPAHFSHAPGFAPAPEPTPGPSGSAPSNPIFERSCASQLDFRVKYRSKACKSSISSSSSPGVQGRHRLFSPCEWTTVGTSAHSFHQCRQTMPPALLATMQA